MEAIDSSKSFVGLILNQRGVTDQRLTLFLLCPIQKKLTWAALHCYNNFEIVFLLSLAVDKTHWEAGSLKLVSH
jgi:hypothetical protein